MQFFNNIFDVKNKGKLVLDIGKLNEGQTYILYMSGDIKCGPLIKNTLQLCMTDPQLYYGIYFRIGLAKYDGITMTDQIHQYHLQSHLNLHSIKLKIYEYNLSSQLQEQIKTWRYYRKTIFNLCKELNIPEDIERLINKYF
jgi:hypothetical protein